MCFPPLQAPALCSPQPSWLKSSLLPFKDAKADGTYYADIADALNAGNTAPFIYSGWENTIVTTGLKMLDFIKGDATMEDVIRQMDEDQDSVVNNTPDTITTVTEELSQEDCAMLVGRCFCTKLLGQRPLRWSR